MRDKRLLYLAMMIAVPLAGEFKFFPLAGDIRVSLGTPVFFFSLLWLKKVRPILAGFVTAIAVVIFRIILEVIIGDSFHFQQAFMLHFPVFFYYFTFACLFWLFRVRSFYHIPVAVGWLGAVCETVASIIEIMVRSFFIYEPITLKSIVMISVIAVVRSFIVIGFFNVIFLRKIKAAEEEQKRRNEQELLDFSHIYVEMFQLKHSMNSAEELTRDCYEIYRELKNDKNYCGIANRVLIIAGKVHEIKKDNQRIKAGLSQLMVNVNLSDFMSIEEIIHIAVSSHKNYSEMLGKSIDFRMNIVGKHPPYHAIILLSIISNLFSNAVEAIEGTGRITLTIRKFQTNLVIKVADNGSGISDRNRDLVFQPGFTTKFDKDGKASNGIGLSYIKRMIENHGGMIHLLDTDQTPETTFAIYIPINRLIERECEI